MLTINEQGPLGGALDMQLPQRRSSGLPYDHWRGVVHRFGHREVRPACREVLVNGSPRKLQPRAFDLLVYMIDHRHRVLSFDELLDAVWPDRDVQIGSLATAVARIRSVLGGAGSGETIIQTHHRVGYRFVAELECDPASVAS